MGFEVYPFWFIHNKRLDLIEPDPGITGQKLVNRFSILRITAAQKLEFFRREDSRCLGLSFPSISGFGAHSAIVHYVATL